MSEFTPLASTAGGVLIGLGAVLLMAGLGRIAGIAGIIGGLLPPPRPADGGWRVAFLAGMVLAAPLMLLASGGMPAIEVPVSLPMLAIGGAIVGLGISYGNGCTSGHGVCGMARLSKRSIAATLTFMATTAATVFVLRHVIGG